MKECETQTVVLKEDNPQIVRLMLNYFYGSDYHAEPGPDQGLSDLETHAAVYGIGEKYGALDMKTLAAKKFGQSAATMTYEDLLRAIRLVYDLTPSSDRGLRDVAIRLWLVVAHDVISERKEEVETLMRGVPDFAFDLSMRLSPLYGHESLEGRCRCGQYMHGRGVGLFKVSCSSCERSAAELKELCARAYLKLTPFW